MSPASPSVVRPLTDGEPPTNPLRLIKAHHRLPGSRAIVGALLITIAAVGAFAVANGATGDHKQPYLVAAHDLVGGTRLQSSDFRVERLTLPTSLSSHVLNAHTQLSGGVLLGPVKSGELVQTGLVTAKASDASQPEIAFSLSASRALDGELKTGESVDLLVTDKGAANSVARTVVSAAKVIHVDKGTSSTVGHSADITVTLAVLDRTSAAAVASAVDEGQVTLVRATGVPMASLPAGP